MDPREAFRIAARSIRAHRLRSALTVVGMVIGIASVVAFATFGASVQAAVIGDIGADVAAALAAGARPVLVPTRHTRTEEIDAAPLVAPDLATAVDILLQPVRTAADPHSDGHPVGSSGPVTDPAGTAA